MTIATPAIAANSEITVARTTGRLAFMDALRGIAALSVVVEHIAVNFSYSSRPLIFNYFDPGHFGVILFFLCSGFVIPLSLEHERSLRTFWVRRCFRIFPVLWLSIAITIVLVAISGPQQFGAYLHENGARILANLTTLQLLLGYQHLRPEYWTLVFEMLFYVLVTILYALRLLRFSVLLASAMLLTTIVLEGIAPLMLGIKMPSGIMGYFATMCVGTVLYRVHTGEVTPRIGVVMMGLGLLMVLATTYDPSLLSGETNDKTNMLLARLAAFAVFSAVFRLRALTFPRLAVFFGTISYSVYMLHTIVMEYVLLGQPLLNILAWVGLTLIVATTSYWLVEKPCINLGRRLTSLHSNAQKRG